MHEIIHIAHNHHAKNAKWMIFKVKIYSASLVFFGNIQHDKKSHYQTDNGNDLGGLFWLCEKSHSAVL